LCYEEDGILITKDQQSKRIPEKEWWCGCHDGCTFDSEEEFVKHMEKAHKSTWSEILKRIREKSVVI